MFLRHIPILFGSGLIRARVPSPLASSPFKVSQFSLPLSKPLCVKAPQVIPVTTIQIPLTHETLWNYRAHPDLVLSPSETWQEKDQLDWQGKLLEYPGPTHLICLQLDVAESGGTPALIQKRDHVARRQRIFWTVGSK